MTSHRLSSGLSAPAGGTDTPVTAGRVVGTVSAGDPAPADSQTLGCPNCLTDLDECGYCDGCSYLATVKRPA